MKKITKFVPFLAFMLCVGAFLFPITTLAAPAQPLTVDSFRVDGETLHIEVIDSRTDTIKAMELDIREFAGTNDEIITVQAIDLDGNKTNVIQFKNPLYEPPTMATTAPGTDTDPQPTGMAGSDSDPTDSPDILDEDQQPTDTPSESGLPDDSEGSPFTPDGSGTVMDNVANSNSKEFFTIKAQDDEVFYLIIDRDRNSENVYFLNAVTEDDLMPLAKPGKSESAIPGEDDASPKPSEPPNVPTELPEHNPKPTPESGISPGALIFIVIAVAAAGGAGWYFKIYKPKQQAAEPDEAEDFDDDQDEDDEEFYNNRDNSGDQYDDEEYDESEYREEDTDE